MKVEEMEAKIKLLEEHNIELAVANKKLRKEIVERTRVEEALRKSEMKYRDIYFNIQDVYYETSPDGIILEISPSIENFSQYKHQELIGKSLYDIYADPEETHRVINDVLVNGKVSDYEINLRDKDNSQRPCSIVMITIKNEQGIPLKFTGSMRDIFKRPAIPIAAERVEVGSRPGGKVFQGPDPQDIQLELKGTIVSGDSSMAIINDKFVRLGEKIENFRVIRITANEVVLKAGHYQRVIQVMKTEKYLSQ